MPKNKNNRTFVRITNKDIYDKLMNVEKHVIKSNGTLEWHSKAIYALFSTIIILAGWIFFKR